MVEKKVPAARVGAARLSGAMRAGALSALEECGDALAIYRRVLEKRAPGLTTTVRTHCYRMEVGNTNHPAFEMATEESNFEKLKQDSQWLEQLLNSAKESLVLEGNLGILIDEVEKKLATRAEEAELLARARGLLDKFHQMRRNVAKEREERAKEDRLCKAELLRLRNEKERLGVLSGRESEYVDAWLDSRQEQRSLEAEITRHRLTEGLRLCEARESNERLVTRELSAFIRLSIEENEKAAATWTERKSAETKQYEREIYKLREEIERKRSALEELRREYCSRRDFIDSCLAEQEAERRRAELEEHRRCRAIEIQAWWRGVMVRRKLGPYRPEEKRRKRPKK
ncbi:IQ domain-containing protein G [Copidosoma floridanum]|uniref:IQ domain-containing protein G n=1 Tax=Copidosoma floridanum TaxID=29053 RepID=UPI000C6F97B1|nr:IQ domain-containing protein G [Copidosoma floridanum]